MSRRNNVRGPTSALTEFLRESGITPTTIARRVRTREVQQPVAGPSTGESAADQDGEQEEDRAEEPREYASDNLDDTDTEMPPPKKKKTSKAAEAKLKAQAKKAAKKKGDDDGDYMDEDEDAYTALSKMWKDDARPSNGSFCECAKCGKQFTVTKYTMAARPGPGFLCHPCYKSTGADPFKKPALPRKRKPAEKRSVTHFEERHIPTLASLCVQILSRHLDDVEALGDISNISLDKIAKAIAKDRSLTPQNAMLLYDVESTSLTLYDATNLIPSALITLSSLNPNLVNLRMDYCGRINNEVLNSWSSSLPHLKRVELLGPFLVYTSAWQTFFESHPGLEGFLITQSPRFDLECMQSLVENCTNLTELRLKEIGKMSDEFLEQIKLTGGQLHYLDLSDPGKPEALSTEALEELMGEVGGSLTHLDLSGNILLGDGFLLRGLKPHTRKLQTLILSNVPDLTDVGVAKFFDTWQAAAEDRRPNPALSSIDLSRCHLLSGLALASLLKHSGSAVENLNINGWKSIPQEVLVTIAKHSPKLKKVDIGWCREADDWVVKELMERCKHIEEVKVWGCQRITEMCPRKRGVSVQGAEALAVA